MIVVIRHSDPDTEITDWRVRRRDWDLMLDIFYFKAKRGVGRISRSIVVSISDQDGLFVIDFDVCEFVV